VFTPLFRGASVRDTHTHYPMRTLRIVAILLLGLALALAISENRDPASGEMLAPIAAP